MALSLDTFIEQYPVQGPNKPHLDEDELRLLGVEDGVIQLPSASLSMNVVGRPGTKEGRHLWVIVPSQIPVILETAPGVRPPPLSAGVAKHSNLTGGKPACCGGELWVDELSEKTLFLNGGSGRYAPRTPQELADAAQVFESLGFAVHSAGWNDENDVPERVFRRS